MRTNAAWRPSWIMLVTSGISPPTIPRNADRTPPRSPIDWMLLPITTPLGVSPLSRMQYISFPDNPVNLQSTAMIGLPGGADIARRDPVTIGAPARRAEHHAQSLAHRARGEHVAHHGRPFVEGNSNRVERRNIFDDSVGRRLIVPLRDEGSEQAVPHHQHAGIVAVEVAGIRRMMDAMMRGGVEK